MKLIIENNIVMNQRGTVQILPEEPDDVWFVYNLISPGDFIIAATTRNVKYSSRVRLSLEISITGVNYHRDSSTLRVHGTTLNTNQHVKKGLFHTVEIELNKEFEIYKVWDKLSIEKLPLGFKNAAGADLAVVLLQPTGFAQVYLLGARQTKLCARVETHSNPNKYFENIFRAFVRHVDLSVVEGEVSREQQATHCGVQHEEQRDQGRDGNFSLHEVLHDGTVMNLIKDTKAVMEIKAFKEFSDLLTTDLDRVCYGAKNVEMAHELKAIETLLITDDLYECRDWDEVQVYRVCGVGEEGEGVCVFVEACFRRGAG
ncbi:hypothetical protein ACLB2K_060157 [Fragaria x ananassa]